MMRRLIQTGLLLCLFPAACKRGPAPAATPSPAPEPLYGEAARVEAVRAASSHGKTALDIAPYDEALAWHEYDVRQVLAGKIKGPRIRVAHWTVVHGKDVPQSTTPGESVQLTLQRFHADINPLDDIAVSDDLDITTDALPRYLDTKILSSGHQTPEALRYDYAGYFSNQMRLYWKLRSQLRLVILGNSHAAKALRPNLLPGQAGLTFPEALNLGAAGANGYMQCLLAREYILPLPKLDTLVWMVSARTFNRARPSNHRLEIFTASPGYQYDRNHQAELWPAPADAPQVSLPDLQTLNLVGTDPWGWNGADHVNMAGSRQDQEKEILRKMTRVRYEFDEPLWNQFTALLQETAARGIRVFLLTSPIHPLSSTAPAADPDNSSHEGLDDLVRRLQALDAQHPLIWFKDTNLSGRHQLQHEDFYDADHLNQKGADKFTPMVSAWIQAQIQTQANAKP